MVSVSDTPGVHLLDEKDQKRLRKLIAEHGMAGVARLLKLSRGVVIAAAGGFGVRRGSINLVQEALKAHKDVK